ncbi:MAG TPA: glycosyltransferase family 2 protein [Dehalococcoidia bacterium]|nr:glycosyltransferase family 2 protein [Dehalococcoidia bacterium]
MSERPAVGIVVVNYNSAAFIDEFCETLRGVEYGHWSLRVVDSGSDDGSAGVIERAFPDADVVRCGDNVGFAAGCNIGVGLCRRHGDDYVLFLNNDVSLTPDFLDRLVDAADERTIVVPKVLFRDDPRLISTHAGGFDWRLGLFRHTYHGKPDGPATNRRRDGLETASFCCALVPLAAFDAAGMLDERFFMYYEETDWLRRARSHGYRIRYEPSAVIYHRESGSSGGGWMTPFKMYYATRNRMYLVRKNAASTWDVAAFTAYFFATRLPSLASLALRRRWRLMRAMLLGIRDYYAGRMGRTMQVRDL